MKVFELGSRKMADYVTSMQVAEIEWCMREQFPLPC
jgi:hypothetical protein